MLQWIPGSQSEILWNDRDGDHYCCHILDVHSGNVRTIPHPIYTLSPDGKTGLSLDFSRLNDVRPGYGYVGIPDPNADQTDAARIRASTASTWRTGAQEMIVSLGEIAERRTANGHDGRTPSISSITYCSVPTPRDSSFFIVGRARRGGETRMYTATPQGQGRATRRRQRVDVALYLARSAPHSGAFPPANTRDAILFV